MKLTRTRTTKSGFEEQTSTDLLELELAGSLTRLRSLRNDFEFIWRFRHHEFDPSIIEAKLEWFDAANSEATQKRFDSLTEHMVSELEDLLSPFVTKAQLGFDHKRSETPVRSPELAWEGASILWDGAAIIVTKTSPLRHVSFQMGPDAAAQCVRYMGVVTATELVKSMPQEWAPRWADLCRFVEAFGQQVEVDDVA